MPCVISQSGWKRNSKSIQQQVKTLKNNKTRSYWFKIVRDPFIYSGLRFLKNHRMKDQLFFIKTGEFNRHCCSLIMSKFCGNDALYSVSVSFNDFTFLLTVFDAKDCYYFKQSHRCCSSRFLCFSHKRKCHFERKCLLNMNQ